MTTDRAPDMDSEDERFARIAAEIEHADSPVGIDAKKTHVLILMKLEEIERRLAALEERAS